LLALGERVTTGDLRIVGGSNKYYLDGTNERAANLIPTKELLKTNYLKPILFNVLFTPHTPRNSIFSARDVSNLLF